MGSNMRWMRECAGWAFYDPGHDDSPCYACGKEARFDELPPRERIAFDQYWRVAHSFNTAVPGWLVLLPRRHVTAVHDLTDAEAGALGVWQVGLSRALRGVTGCLKTYVVQFAESEGFAHVHFHIVPRMADLPAAHRGRASSGSWTARGRRG